MPQERKVLRTIYLDEETDDKLRLLAHLSGKKKNEIIEEILDWVFSGMVGRPPKALNYLKSL